MTKVHLIGNAHLDPVWLWRHPEGYAEVLATFRSALDRMNEFDDYIFTCAGAAYYVWVQETDPAMFDEIKARVCEGRWIIAGGWWIQPDCNAPCGESFARHALYSQRFYDASFGQTAQIGYNVDSFGHNAMLPQLLRQGGMSGYVYMRPDPGTEMTYPFQCNAFMWRGLDGTMLPAFHIPFGYAATCADEALLKAEACLKLSNDDRQPVMCFYGIGNHGGGPTRAMLTSLNRLILEANADDYAYSSPKRFFAELEMSNLPVLNGELQHHASGCYSAVMEIKQLNRQAEALLMNAEKYACMAKWLGFDIDTAALTDAWKIVLFNQFHDIMGGCCIREACAEAIEAFCSAKQTARDIINRVLQKITWNIDTSKGFPILREKCGFKLWDDGPSGAPLTVFNPHSWPVHVPVHTGADIHTAGRSPAVTDESGCPIPFQRVRGPMINHDADKWESVFIAEVPPMGWRTYWVRYTDEIVSPMPGELSCGDTFLENTFIRAEFSPETGALIRLYDKTHDLELLRSPALDLVMDETEADTWAHRVFSFRNLVGSFSGANIRLIDSGSVYAALRITTHWNCSTIIRIVKLYRTLPALYVSCTVVWNEAHKMLKLSFPTPFTEVETASIPFGFLKRQADGLEQPMQNWVSLGHLGVVTDTRTAYDAFGGELRVTALRSPLYADHFAERDDLCELSEQGEHHFNYALTGDINPEHLAMLADELLCPPDSIYGTYHAGSLALTAAQIRLDNHGFIVDAIKPAEDGNGYIVRVHEANGRDSRSLLTIPLLNMSVPLVLQPHQVLTLRVSDSVVHEVDFTENAVDRIC